MKLGSLRHLNFFILFLALALAGALVLPACSGDDDDDNDNSGSEAKTDETATDGTLSVRVNFSDSNVSARADSIRISMFDSEKVLSGCVGITGNDTVGIYEQKRKSLSEGLSIDFTGVPFEQTFIILGEALAGTTILASGCIADIKVTKDAQEETIDLAKIPLMLEGEYSSTIEIPMGYQDFDQIAAVVEALLKGKVEDLDAFITFLSNINEMLLNATFQVSFTFTTQKNTVNGTMMVEEFSDGAGTTVDVSSLGIYENFTGNLDDEDNLTVPQFAVSVDVFGLIELILQNMDIPSEYEKPVQWVLLALKSAPELKIDTVNASLSGKIFNEDSDSIAEKIEGEVKISVEATQAITITSDFEAQLQ
jgi:hypothetical protein